MSCRRPLMDIVNALTARGRRLVARKTSRGPARPQGWKHCVEGFACDRRSGPTQQRDKGSRPSPLATVVLTPARGLGTRRLVALQR